MKYNTLGRTGILVSELCFGTMTFGGQGYWSAIGQTPQEEANGLTKQAFDAGINFFDTANAYSEGQSETILGNAIRETGLPRNEMFLATKLRIRMAKGANNVGLSRGHIHESVHDSLRRLQLDHIDLLYVHGVDPLTPLEETMRGLHEVISAGKVRYIGICNHPAWMVAKANGIADSKGYTRFSAMQYLYTLAHRETEFDLAPMAQSEGMGLMPWSPLAGGFLSGKYTRESEKSSDGKGRRDNFDFPPINKEKAYDIIEAMQPIAAAHNVSVAQVALKWLLNKQAVTSVIIGAKRSDQLADNIASTQLELSSGEMQQLDEVSAIAAPYPVWMVQRQLRDRFPGQAI